MLIAIYLEKNYNNIMKCFLFLLAVICVMLLANSESAFSEQYDVLIPFGSYDPRLNTPTDVWYEPPEIFVSVGDTITWFNEDKETHNITSGEGTGRFGWTDLSESYGDPTGFFGSDLFTTGESWSFTFNERGAFRYYCTVHPWMEGIVYVDQLVPDYPHDAKGNKQQFPILQVTPDQSVEINFSWEPKVIRTYKKVNFIYRFYDVNDLPFKKIQYDIIIIQNGKEVFRDENAVSGFGGDYRQWVFEEPGPAIIKFRNIQSAGSEISQGLSDIVVGSSGVTLTENSAGRIGEFTVMVYFNPIKESTSVKIVQPKETAQLYYEIPAFAIIIPIICIILAVYLVKRKSAYKPYEKKSTAV